MPYYISPPPQNPLARIITAIVAMIVLAGAFMVGMVALLIVAAVGLIAGLVIWVRVLWIKRQLQKNGVDLGVSPQRSPPSGNVIDAEYTVISESSEAGKE